MTPTGRKLQDGTRAVARQLTNDILPSLVANRRSSSSTSTLESSSPLSPFPLPLPPLPRPEEVSRVGNRVWSAVSNQMQRNLETLQADLANPSRIPERIAKQNKDLLVEAGNIFSEKPAGLREPKYTVVSTYVDYEIRDYQTYTVATTNIGELKTASTMASASDEQPFAADQGVAFNTLASYIFGANADQRPMEMTTPVTTTASGEMRFFVPDSAPDPLAQDATQSAYEQSKIRIERIPAARLAVRRFTGFCTAGEIARQKEALLAAIALDGDQVELDVPHGQTVGHVVFQYNPPYTLPVIRCNEIAVPVMVPSDEEELVGNSWELTATNGLSA